MTPPQAGAPQTRPAARSRSAESDERIQKSGLAGQEPAAEQQDEHETQYAHESDKKTIADKP